MEKMMSHPLRPVILEEIAKYNPAPDEIFPIMQIRNNLYAAGNEMEEIDLALKEMLNHNLLKEPDNPTPHWHITKEGHKLL